MPQLIIILAVLLSLTGCFYPTKHVYFVPSAADGRLELGTTSLGYTNSVKDEIRRNIAGVPVSIVALYYRGAPLTISLALDFGNSSLHTEPSAFQLKDEISGKVHLPIDVKKKRMKHRWSIKDSEPTEREWITLSYSPISDQLEQFTLSFPHGSFTVNGNDASLSPVSFRKVEVDTWRLITINN
ncbi:MAG: hypothetical protein AB9873_11000 [Syntrophobacteraceae bacterium]